MGKGKGKQSASVTGPGKGSSLITYVRCLTTHAASVSSASNGSSSRSCSTQQRPLLDVARFEQLLNSCTKDVRDGSIVQLVTPFMMGRSFVEAQKLKAQQLAASESDSHLLARLWRRAVGAEHNLQSLCVSTIAANADKMDAESLDFVLNTVSASTLSAFSIALCRHNHQQSHLASLFSHLASVRPAISELCVRIDDGVMVESLLRQLPTATPPPPGAYIDSWEELPISTLHLPQLAQPFASTLLRLSLIGSVLSCEQLHSLSTLCSSLEDLTLHRVFFTWQSRLAPSAEQWLVDLLLLSDAGKEWSGDGEKSEETRDGAVRSAAAVCSWPSLSRLHFSYCALPLDFESLQSLALALFTCSARADCLPSFKNLVLSPSTLLLKEEKDEGEQLSAIRRQFQSVGVSLALRSS